MDKILVAYDHSDAAQVALGWAIDYSVSREAEVLLVYAASSLAEWELAAIQVDPDPLRRDVEHLLRSEWSQPLRDSGVPFDTRVLVGRPAEAVVHCAETEDASLIILGLKTRGTLAELVARKTAEHILRHANRPVVAVPVTSREAATNEPEFLRRDHVPS